MVNIKTNTDIFTYSSLSSLITEEENNFLYNICNDYSLKYSNQIEDLSYFILDKISLHKYGLEECKKRGLVQSNVGISSTFKVNELFDVISERLTQLQINDIHYPLLKNKYTNEDCKWKLSLTHTCTDNICELRPHSDWVEKVPVHHRTMVGFYKGVIYLGDFNINYANYGTRIYMKNPDDVPSNPSLEYIEPFLEIEEIPFVPTNGVLFKTAENSFHGTDYKNTINHKRFTITMEYY